MSRLYLTLFFVSIFFNAFAHQPDISTTVLSQQKNGTWVLQIRAALTAFESEVHVKYGEDAYKSPEEFNDLVIEHVVNNLSIVFNKNQKVQFLKPLVRLGHETNVIFEIAGVPNDIETVQFRNSSFSNISRNQSALMILLNGMKKKQFILNAENKHEIELRLTENQFVLNQEMTKRKYLMPVVIFITLAIFLGLAAFFRLKSKGKEASPQ